MGKVKAAHSVLTENKLLYKRKIKVIISLTSYSTTAIVERKNYE
jgi:hypothetical protein